MENHPIPQDITSFQFKLIGDMTIKQFAYLAAGSILAWIIFSVPIIGVVKIPIAVFIFMVGFSLGFIPLEGRPLDTMISLFFKALFVPNEYIFKKEGQIAILHISLKHITKPKTPKPSSYERLQSVLKTTASGTRPNRLDEKEMIFFQSLSTFYSPMQALKGHAYANPTVSPEPIKPPVKPAENTQSAKKIPETSDAIANEEKALDKQANVVKKEIEAAKIQESLEKETKSSEEAHKKVEELESQLQSMLLEKQRLEEELKLLSQKLNNQNQNIFSPGTFIPPKTQNVVSIPKSMSKQTGMPIVPEIPNILAGIVKDARGNILVNTLIEVKDKDGNPVRAFKTNSLGQFSSATPLLNGTYTIEFEDPRGKQKFDKIQLVAKGEIIPPIEVFSTDEREELRKELFKT